MARQKRAIQAGRRVIAPASHAPASQAKAGDQVFDCGHFGPRRRRVFAVDGRAQGQQGSGFGQVGCHSCVPACLQSQPRARRSSSLDVALSACLSACLPELGIYDSTYSLVGYETTWVGGSVHVSDHQRGEHSLRPSPFIVPHRPSPLVPRPPASVLLLLIPTVI